MSGWVVPANQGPGVQLPAGVQVAGMGRRVGAWILDRILAGFLALIPVILAIVMGAVTLNDQALEQLRNIDPEAYRPFDGVTAPLFNVSVGPLVFAAVLYVALNAAYYAGCWVKFGGTPCQQGLRLHVADVSNGRNLSMGSSLLRWAVLEGIATCVGALFVVLFFDAAAKTPTNQWLGSSYYTSTFGSGSFGSIALISSIVSWGSLLWFVVLIVSAGTHPANRGLHDRLVGSIVVSPVQAAPSWPGYAYPPQGAPNWPPQGGPGYQSPPQGWPGYPPQTPGYPPQQGWPGYPPQGTPPAQPMPPAPPDGPASGSQNETPGQ